MDVYEQRKQKTAASAIISVKVQDKEAVRPFRATAGELRVPVNQSLW